MDCHIDIYAILVFSAVFKLLTLILFLASYVMKKGIRFVYVFCLSPYLEY